MRGTKVLGLLLCGWHVRVEYGGVGFHGECGDTKMGNAGEPEELRPSDSGP